MATSLPSTLDFINQTVTHFSQGTTNTDWSDPASILGSCVISPFSYQGVEYPQGALIIDYLTPTGHIVTEAFDPSTLTRMSILGLDVTTTVGVGLVASIYIQCKPYPLGRGTPGYVAVYLDAPGLMLQTRYIKVIRPQGVSDVLSFVVDDNQTFMDVSPIPRASRPAFHVARRQDTNDSSAIHLYFYFEAIDYATGSGTISLLWSRRYVTGDWPDWTIEPTGVQCINDVWGYFWDRSQTMAVIGDVQWDSTLKVWKCVSPRLAVLNGGVNGSGEILGSTDDLSAGYVTCMASTQSGLVFVGGEGSLSDSGDTDGSIEAYAFTRSGDLWTPVQTAHYSLSGSVFTGNPQYMTWDGNRLIVFFLGTDRQIGIFDSSLNLLASWAVPSQSQPGNNLSTNAWNAAARSSQRWLGWNT